MKVRKILIVIVLAAVLAGIAYVKALFSHQDRDGGSSTPLQTASPSFPGGGASSENPAGRSLDSIRLVYADSVTQLSMQLASLRDSVATSGNDSLLGVVERLTDSLHTAQKGLAEARSLREKQLEQMVLGFYKGELASLPADLSNYEKGVSVKEIKAKAREYFGVSQERLEKILKKAK
jgi:hypothetical protein